MNVAIRLRPQKSCRLATMMSGWRCLVVLVLALCFLKADAQSKAAAGEPDTARRRGQVQAAKLSLRDGELAAALKSLEALAESSNSVSLMEPDDVAAICAGLHRALSQMSSQQQFDILSKWSMPAESPGKIRVLSALVPTVAPPAEFSRVLGERPGRNSFPISSIGAVRGIYSTAWSLVTSARDCGRLKRLMTDLTALADRKVPGAELLLTLAIVVDERVDVAAVVERLAARARQIKIKEAGRPAVGPQFLDRDNLVLATAAINHPGLCPVAEQLVAALLASTNGQTAPSVRPFLRRTYATACLLHEDPEAKRTLDLLLAPNFKYWLPVSEGTNRSSSRTSPTASWLVHEDHILHLTGAPDDALLLRFPLTGNFQFQVEVQLGGQAETDGGVTYGGLQFGAVGNSGDFTVRDASGRAVQTRYCPFAHRPGQPSFNKLSIGSNAGKITASVNLHPMWSEQIESHPSPWIGLTSSGAARPLFRNLKLTGHPVIPRTVSMINGSELRGWRPQTWGPQSDSKAKDRPDWNVAKGVIQAARQSPAGEKTVLNQQLLSYVRPLLDGEAIHYEFFYEAEKCDVSPTLDRMAFLVRPDGVRVHWITDDDDWTSLPSDNTVIEPLCRRGPRPLPLKAADWNRLSVNRTEQTVTLLLNDVVIYQRPIDWEGDHHFGLYRQGTGTEVKVRELVMTGNWPEKLPDEFRNNPTMAMRPPVAASEQRALHRIFREEFLASNVFAVRRRALAMPLAERFQFLSDWLLPGPNHPGIRMAGEFTPTRPAPSVLEPGVNHPEIGGQILSPVFDWLDAARELGRLSECRQRIESIVVGSDDEQQRARLSLLLMLSLESEDRTILDKEWDTLFGLLKKETSTEDENHWPEVLLAVRGVTKSRDNAQCAELISDLVGERMLRWHRPDIARWHNHLASLNGQILQRKRNAAGSASAVQTVLRDWVPATAGRAHSYGYGHPDLKWSRQGETVIKDSGHSLDYLFYRFPLSGDFQIECDLVLPTHNPIAVMTAGTYVGLLGGLNGIETGTFRDVAPHVLFEPALTNWGKRIRFRAEISEDTRTVYLNGRKTSTVSLPRPRDPWIAFRSPGWHPSSFSNVRIQGQAKVLDAVDLSQMPDLTGWVEYHKEGQWANVAQSDGSAWIVGQANPAYAGMFAEGLLRYQRPLQDGESIQYEFFHQPGSVETAPVLDRLAFLLHPSGIREHWITDGHYGPVELAPDNIADVPQNRRGPAKLPLNAGAWNRLRLTIRGTTARIELNGQLVYERVIESENQRAFGLFHDVGATQARVRNVILSGDWPKTLPAVTDQELAGDTLEWLDADLPRLKSVFTHRFDSEGLPEEYFENPNRYPITITKDGAQASLSSDKTEVSCWIIPRFSVAGDFDLEASFSDVSLAARTRHCCITLRTIFDEPQRPVYDMLRFMNEKGIHLARAGQWFSQPTNPGGQMWRDESDAWEASSGRLRLARRGQKLHSLFADGDAGTFRLVSTEEVSQADLVRHGIQLQASATTGGTTNVTWKGVSLRAERMTWFPPPQKTNLLQLKVIQADGSGSRTVARPSSAGFTHIGSPEWSADGRRIAVDMSNGSTTTSHVFVLNVDGTDLRDLGLGCMPSFSADGERLAFSQPGNGVMTMKFDGTDRQVVDREGWGTQWSPDGKWIAYGKLGNITLLKVATRESRQLLVGETALRYGSIYWNLAWSHDSCAIAFKGRSRETNQDELAVAEIDAPDRFTVVQAAAAAVLPDIAFSPDNKQVIVAMDPGDNKGHKLHALSRSQPATAKLLDFVPAGQVVDGVAWSRDGKTIAVTALQVAEPTAWVTGMKSDSESK